ncbi:MAG: cbb3-type cytochrome oxidase subunit 3 [Erythrobacter sp.]
MSLYDTLRHFADSYALAAMCALYLALCLWHFRPAARDHRTAAKHSIFGDDDND